MNASNHSEHKLWKLILSRRGLLLGRSGSGGLCLAPRVWQSPFLRSTALQALLYAANTNNGILGSSVTLETVEESQSQSLQTAALVGNTWAQGSR